MEAHSPPDMGVLEKVSNAQVEAWCSAWWAARDLYADHALFQEGGSRYVEGGFNPTRCWLWQMEQFLQSTLEHDPGDGSPRQSFRPCDLSRSMQQRLVGTWGLDIGLFYRDMEKLYKKHYG